MQSHADADGDREAAGRRELRMIQGITLSLEGAGIALGEQPVSEALDALVARHFPGFSLDADLRRSILEQRRLDGNFTNPTENGLGRMIARRTGFYWGTSGHTTEAVAIGAIGPGAEGFRGYQDNTEFGKRLHALVSGQSSGRDKTRTGSRGVSTVTPSGPSRRL